MIIIRSIGGLGNQMFQYALARKLSILNSTEFKLDISWHKKNPDRPYQLYHFNILENITTEYPISGKILNITCNILPFSKMKYIKEKSIDFDPDILEVRGNVYLEGYWQSEKYFKDIYDILKNDFTFKTQPDSKNESWIHKMQTENSVCVHIRRGDYVLNPQTNRIHGLCSLKYYSSAIGLITERIKDPIFYIFSDDPNWVKNNINIESPTFYISNNPSQNGPEDFRLMTWCKHYIIANSSFSWWAAWLSNNRSNKIVICPVPWFMSLPYNPSDRVPSDWIQLNAY